MLKTDFQRQIDGYGLTTANILYHMPDFPGLLQSFIWQDYDLAPDFPELNKFLTFWASSLDGPLHSVRVAHKGLIAPAQMRMIDGMFTLH